MKAKRKPAALRTDGRKGHAVNVWIDEETFDKFLNWVADFEREHGVRVSKSEAIRSILRARLVDGYDFDGAARAHGVTIAKED